MNAVQIHLALNHVPLIMSITGGVILILGMSRKNESFKILSLYLLVVAALLSIPVFLSGEGTEELVEHLPGVNESAIEQHEDFAKISYTLILITGGISLIGVFLKKNVKASKIILSAVLILSLTSFGTMAQTAHLGGLIRHSELQNVSTNPTDEKGELKKAETDDDD